LRQDGGVRFLKGNGRELARGFTELLILVAAGGAAGEVFVNQALFVGR
jgi:hypothetical protein